jgi:hypothetical protein
MDKGASSHDALSAAARKRECTAMCTKRSTMKKGRTVRPLAIQPLRVGRYQERKPQRLE